MYFFTSSKIKTKQRCRYKKNRNILTPYPLKLFKIKKKIKKIKRL